MTSFASGNCTANSDHQAHTIKKPVGRFAPSPSGPLHFGSLISALASYLDARSQNGTWLLRIDDIDTPRMTDGSEDNILQCLAAHGLHWDTPLSRQSEHAAHYTKALRSLAEQDRLFFCNCSRRSLRDQPRYPGTCRANHVTPQALERYLAQTGERSHAIRLLAPTSGASFHDELQTENSQASAVGDYVVFRRDGLVSYQLAVVVDDMLTGVNRVVRGADLLPTTARQHQLHKLLDNPPPTWLHLPVLLNQRNTKLSKQAHALPVDHTTASMNLDVALQLLGQNPPADAGRMSPPDLLAMACEQWRPEKLPAEQTFSTFVSW